MAAALPRGVRVTARPDPAGSISIEAWGIDEPLGAPGAVATALRSLAGALGVGLDVALRGEPEIPSRVGLGSSAALAVAAARALLALHDLPEEEDRVLAAAFEAERVFHGTPSGLDPAVAAHGGFVLFRRGEPIRELRAPAPVPLVVGIVEREGTTRDWVLGLRRRWEREPERYERIFEAIDRLVGRALECLEEGALGALGALMDENQALLEELGVSTPPLEGLLRGAREAGALGAKLTGAGGGGAALALPAKGAQEAVLEAWRRLGARPFLVRLVARTPGGP